MNNISTKDKLDQLLDLTVSKFSSWEIDFLTDMQYLEEFSSKQKEKIEELWQKHIGES